MAAPYKCANIVSGLGQYWKDWQLSPDECSAAVVAVNSQARVSDAAALAADPQARVVTVPRLEVGLGSVWLSSGIHRTDDQYCSQIAHLNMVYELLRLCQAI